MRVICLLLCIALAQGHIFKRHERPRMDQLKIQPLDYAYTLYTNQEQTDQRQYPQVWTDNVAYRQNPEAADEEGIKIQTVDNDPIKSVARLPKRVYDLIAQQKGISSGEIMGNLPKYLHQKWTAMQAEKYPYLRERLAQLDKSMEKQTRLDEQQQVQHNHEDSEASRQQTEYTQQYHQVQGPDSTSDERVSETQQNYAQPRYAKKHPYRGASEMKPAYGDAVSWRGYQFAARPSEYDDMKEEIEKIFSGARNTITHLSEERKAMLHEAVMKQSEESQLNATQMLQNHQYPVETHVVKTDDGYYLTMYRIAPKDGSAAQPRPVVFLMHGLLGSADDWLVMGPGKSLAYMLYDAGYEVWLGNARGNKYSRRHVSKYPAQPDFWQFSIDEIALLDLPTMIDYVLKTTQQEKMFYVGHSLGTTAFFALAAARPEYNNNIIMMYAMSPMVYMSEARSPLLRVIAPMSKLYERLKNEAGDSEFNPSVELVRTLGGDMCMKEIGCEKVCNSVNFLMSGFNVNNLDYERIPVIMAHLSGGVSDRVMRQYGQAVASREFTMYNYGPVINKAVYGDENPPAYDMSKVEAPVALYYGEDDWLAHPKDVEKLAKELPNVKDSYKVSNFSSMDFQYSKNAPEVVYNRLMNSIRQNTQENYFY